MTTLLRGFADLCDPQPDPYLQDPVGWVGDRLKEELWSAQRHILESVRDHRRTAVHSAHGAGKSHVAARAIAWWIESHPPGSAFVVSTAPSWQQVKAILWREVGRAHRKGKLVGRVNQTEWWIANEMVGLGRKPPDEDEEGFQGIHATYVLVVVDEAAGIPEPLWTGVLALLTTADCRVLAIGNPDYEGSRFSKMCTPGSGWNVVHIDGLRTPNFTDEKLPAGAPLLDQSWIDDLVSDYGDDSPTYLAKVRGLFPSDRMDGAVPWSWAHACHAPDVGAAMGPIMLPVELGVDVGGGTDLTIIRERVNNRAGRRWSLSTENGEVIVDAVLDAVRQSGATRVKIDFGGIGFGVASSLQARARREVSWPVRVDNVTFGAAAKDQKKYLNVRAEMYWEARIRSKDKAWFLGDMEASERTMADLCEPRWFEAKDGRIQLEEKDQIRKRLGRSPDDGDALVLAFYEPPDGAPVAQVTRYRQRALRGTR